MLKHIPSMQAAAALFLSNKVLKVSPPWPDHLKSTYTESQIWSCAKDLCTLLQVAPTQSLEAVKKKFSMTKFLEVAKIKVS